MLTIDAYYLQDDHHGNNNLADDPLCAWLFNKIGRWMTLWVFDRVQKNQLVQKNANLAKALKITKVIRKRARRAERYRRKLFVQRRVITNASPTLLGQNIFCYIE